MDFLSYWIQFVINGLVAGSLYALIATGFSVIYNTNKFIHFAHGGISILGGYFFYSLSQSLGINYVLATVLAGFLSGLTGYVIFQFVYSPLKKKSASNVIMLLSSIALLIIIQNLTQLFYGEQVKVIDVTTFNRSYEIMTGIITSVQIIILIVCFFLFVSLYLFINKSKFGRNMRAIANNNELADIVGINAHYVKSMSFFIGSFIGGIGGVLIALDQSLTPTKGAFFILKGFTGAIIGGLEYVPAAILGSYFLGLIENLAIIYLPSEQKLTISFLLLFVFLIFRPQGFLGFSSGGRK